MGDYMTKADIKKIVEVEDEDTLKGKYLIFPMGNEFYGLELRYVTEITGISPITQVPFMPAYIKGVINLRGKIIPVMDARLRFKKDERAYDGRTCIIVLDDDIVTLGLIVDGVSEVIELTDDNIEPSAELGGYGSKYIKGIGKVGSSVKLILDCEKLLTDPEL